MRTHMRDGGTDNVKNSLKEAEYQRQIQIQRLNEKWSQHKVVGANFGKLNAREQALVSVLCENQLNHMNAVRQLKEYQVSSVFGLTPEKVLEVVRLAAPNSNLGNIFREVPMLSTDDAFYYIDAVYATNKTRSPSVSGTKYYESQDAYFASERTYTVVGTGDGSTTTFSYALPTLPVRPYTVILVVNGAYAGADNGSGVITSALLSAGTVDYTTTGIVALTFATAPANTVEIGIEFAFDSEETSNFDEFGELNLSVRKFKLNATPSPLGFSYNKLAELVLNTTGLGDAKEILMKSVTEELMKARDMRALKLAKRVAKSNATVTFSADFAAAGAENEIDHAQTITAKIESMGNAIYNDLKRGGITKIVAGAGATTYLRYHRTFTEDNSQPRVGLHLVGKIAGTEVYKAPGDSSMVANNEILGVYKNDNNEAEASIVFGTLIPLFDAGTLTYPQQFKTEGAIAHYGDQAIVQPKFLRLMSISSLTL